MAKDPAFLFYTNDFSTGTQFLTDEQLGKYLRLLMAQHQHGRLTEKQVLFICKSYDNDILIKFKKDDNHMFFNERLEEEIFKRKKFTESRSNNKSGRKKALKPVLNNNSIKNEEESYDLSYDNHMENRNRNKNKGLIKKEKPKKEEPIYRSFKHLTLYQHEFDKLFMNYTKEEIDTTLDAIENHKNNKNYTSLYLTANNWLKKDLERKLENGTKQTTFSNERQRRIESVDRATDMADQVLDALGIKI